MQYYPVFLNLSQRRVIVIGGGNVALEKVEGLIKAEACVTVIAREVVAPLRELIEKKRITQVAREYCEGDLAGAFLVISTLNDTAVNARIFGEAEAKQIAVNVVDDPPHCSWIAPSI